MVNKSYGVVKRTILHNEVERYLEELSILGYAIVEKVLSTGELKQARTKLDEVYESQESELGEGYNLKDIGEQYVVRLPLAYDEFFVKLAMNSKIMRIIKRVLGNYFVLHLQNGIINMPKTEHRQSAWHRDLPYHDLVTSRPVAISVLYCIDAFSIETGGTCLVPYSHKLDRMASDDFIDRYAVQISAKPGSVLVMDSMVYHKAGYNSSNQIRRSINHVYAAGILKQQINIPSALKGRFSDNPFLRMLLGYQGEVPSSVFDWRRRRFK